MLAAAALLFFAYRMVTGHARSLKRHPAAQVENRNGRRFAPDPGAAPRRQGNEPPAVRRAGFGTTGETHANRRFESL